MRDVSATRRNSLADLAATSRHLDDVSLRVLPDAAKILLRVSPDSAPVVAAAFGVPISTDACCFLSSGDRATYWLGPDEWMLESTADDANTLCDRLEQALMGISHSVVDVSHGSDALAVSGSRAAYALNHGCPLDLSLSGFPIGMCTRTIIGKATVVLSRPAVTLFHIDVGRSFAPYVWQFIEDARREQMPSM